MEAPIKGRRLGDWEAAAESALRVLKYTDAQGRNSFLAALLTYRDARDHEALLNALSIVEICAGIAPWIIERPEIVELASHPNFSVRSSAASICLEIARVAPGRIPIDILIDLSRYNEDWYVQAPANAALKTVAHAVPAVLRIFLGRLQSEQRDEREHAAMQLFDISNEEPEILDPEKLKSVLRDLGKRKDKAAGEIVEKALENARKVKRKKRYKYGL